MMTTIVRFRKIYIISALSVVILIIICAVFIGGKSSPGSAALPLADNFSCDISLKYSGMSLSGSITRTGPGQCTVTIKEPKALGGMRFDVTGEGIEISYGKLKLPLGSIDIPESNLFEPLCRTLDAAMSPDGLKMDRIDGKNVFHGKSSLSSFEITCADDGQILNIKIPGYELDVNMENYSVNK